MRLLQEHNPDITFDWARLRGSVTPGGPAGPGSSGSRDERRRDRRDERRRPGAPPAAPPARAAEAPGAADFTETADSRAAAADFSENPDAGQAEDFTEDADSRVAAGVETGDPGAADGGAADGGAADGGAADGGATDVTDSADVVAGPLAESAEPVETSSAFRKLGAEGLGRLRARYADVRGRLEGKPLDEAVRADCLARVERLNPDAWRSEEEVAHALEEYETIFESLRPFIGRQPRPRRL